MPLALEAAGVSKRYGEVVALDDVWLSVAHGECVALVGESGSGKTTLLRAFNALTRVDRGIVRTDGRDVAGLEPPALRRAVGYVPQDGALLPHWTVARNVGVGPVLAGRTGVEDAVAEALEAVGLPASQFGTRWPRELSGGQRQRVAFARALAAKARIVLLDEPFGALDAMTRGDVQELFLELRARVRMAALLVTHDLHEAGLVADRVAVMHHGRVEQTATPSDLLAAPATPYVAELLRRARVNVGARR